MSCTQCNQTTCNGSCGEITIEETFCINPGSEIIACNNCGCNDVIVDLGRILSKNKIKSSDKTISIDPFTLDNNWKCGTETGWDLNFDGEFYVNGHRVFCQPSSNPKQFHWCVEAIGADIRWESDDCSGCQGCGSVCDKMIIDIASASFAQGLQVGCIGDSVGSLKTIKRPDGYVKWYFNCDDFTLVTNDENADGTDDSITLQLRRKPIYTINDQAPANDGDYKICSNDPIQVTTSSSACSNEPGTKIELKYNVEDFKLDVNNALALHQTEYIVYGSLGSPVSIDPAVDASGTPITGDPDWVVGGTTMDMWEKDITVGTSVVIPYTAPANWKWYLDINIQIDAYPVFPSGGDSSTPVPASGVVQAKAYVNNSLTSDVSGKQREAHPYTISPDTISRGDGVIKGVFNVPQTQGASVPVRVVLQYSTPSATRATMWRVESSSELSYSGFLRLVKIS